MALGIGKHKIRWLMSSLVLATLLLSCALGSAQTRKPTQRQVRKTQPPTELAKLHEEFIKATNDYKASLAKLLVIYERNVKKAEEHLAQTQKLQAEGLISKEELLKSETAVGAARDQVSDAQKRMANADAQIASTLLEARAEAQLAKTPLRNRTLVQTTSYIRYSGSGNWALSEAWKVQRFFSDAFKRQLPIAVFGQGAIHDRWRLDHRNSMDISLHPDGPEGQALVNFLRANGIPFLAFRSAIPGTATGPHIHVGRPSHRY